MCQKQVFTFNVSLAPQGPKSKMLPCNVNLVSQDPKGYKRISSNHMGMLPQSSWYYAIPQLFHDR